MPTPRSKNGRSTPIAKTISHTTVTPAPQKRFLILVQHEVIMYGEDEKAATRSLLHSKFMRERTNVKCVYVQELPLHDKQEAIIDCRTAPGT